MRQILLGFILVLTIKISSSRYFLPKRSWSQAPLELNRVDVSVESVRGYICLRTEKNSGSWLQDLISRIYHEKLSYGQKQLGRRNYNLNKIASVNGRRKDSDEYGIWTRPLVRYQCQLSDADQFLKVGHTHLLSKVENRESCQIIVEQYLNAIRDSGLTESESNNSLWARALLAEWVRGPRFVTTFWTF